MRRFLLALLVLPSVASAAGAPGDAMREADRAFCRAALARDEAAFARFLADDLKTFPGGALKTGSAAMVEAWAPFFAPGGPTMSWEPDGAQASEAGDLGYTWGTYVRTTPGKDGAPAKKATGRYVTIWKRGADGAYRAVLDIGTPPSPVQ